MPRTKNNETKANYWHEQIQTWQVSGQSQQAFCKVNGLSYPRFAYWRGKFRRAAAAPTVKTSGFVPVSGYTPPSCGLSLVLPNGIELRGLSQENLPLVAQLLSHLP
ncbi:MAG: hypothetical protein ABW168_05525 [Sedimenticola sp.]